MSDEDAAAVCDAYSLARQRMDEAVSMDVAVEVLRGRRQSLGRNAAWAEVAAAIAEAGLMDNVPAHDRQDTD